ncbi:zinc-ribbon domain-containing protein [Halosimplex sp. J119]
MSFSIVDGVRRLLGSSTASVVECRRCGTSLDEGAEQCPECGSEALSRYDL